MNCEGTIRTDGWLFGWRTGSDYQQPIEQPLRDRCNCDQAYEAHGALIHAIGKAASYYKAFSRAIAPSATGSRTLNPKTVEMQEPNTRNALND